MIDYNKIIPKLEYNGVLISDISHRFMLSPKIAELSSEYTNVLISENETPERLSLRMYGTQDYWWLILATNHIIDPFYEWLMTEEEVTSYAEKLHGVDGKNDVKHYEDAEYNIYSESWGNGSPTPFMESHLFEELTRDEFSIEYNYVKQGIPYWSYIPDPSLTIDGHCTIDTVIVDDTNPASESISTCVQHGGTWDYDNEIEKRWITFNLKPVTHIEWMMHLNDEKRRVNIVQKKHLPELESEFKKMFKGMKQQYQEV